jgi:hypothetical protein
VSHKHRPDTPEERFLDANQRLYIRLFESLMEDDGPDAADLEEGFRFCERARRDFFFERGGRMEKILVRLELVLPAASRAYFLRQAARNVADLSDISA